MTMMMITTNPTKGLLQDTAASTSATGAADATAVIAARTSACTTAAADTSIYILKPFIPPIAILAKFNCSTIVFPLNRFTVFQFGFTTLDA